MSNPAKGSAKNVEFLERRRKALELRKSGCTFDQIASALGYSDRANARRDFLIALHEIIREPAEEVLVLEIERCDALLLGVWSKAKRGEPQAIDAALKIMARRAKYLGLDAVQKHDITVHAVDLKSCSDEQLTRIAAGEPVTLLESPGDAGDPPQEQGSEN